MLVSTMKSTRRHYPEEKQGQYGTVGPVEMRDGQSRTKGLQVCKNDNTVVNTPLHVIF
jgi:hypothetical protein